MNQFMSHWQSATICLDNTAVSLAERLEEMATLAVSRGSRGRRPPGMNCCEPAPVRSGCQRHEHMECCPFLHPFYSDVGLDDMVKLFQNDIKFQ